jgi:patatin-like phospholipase/acyl hydrolase
LEEIKIIRFKEKTNLSNVLVGGIVGALLLGAISKKNFSKITGKDIHPITALGTGTLMGGLLGALFGYDLKGMNDIANMLRYRLLRWKH